MILLIDNYDSFTFNLYQYLGELGAKVVVKRNDEITLEEAEALNFSHLVLSPGPGRPVSAGNLLDFVRHFHGKKPILGICLGHQAIGDALGGKVVHAPELFHGKISQITHDGKGIFQGLPTELQVARYHSLILEEETLPKELEITSRTQEGLVMGVRHQSAPTEGMQFHPESILTPMGMKMLKNFIQI